MNTDLFEIIRTTRSMRRLKPDPVPPTLIRQVLEAGTAAASGGNIQNWRFLVVRDPAVKADVAQFYRRAWYEVVAPMYGSAPPPSHTSPDRHSRTLAAAQHLADHLQEAPVWIIACLTGCLHPKSDAASPLLHLHARRAVPWQQAANCLARLHRPGQFDVVHRFP